MKHVIAATLFILVCACGLIPEATQNITITPTQFKGNLTPDPTPFLSWHNEQGNDTNRYNGYYNEFSEWIPGVVKAESQFFIMPDLVIGDVWGYGTGTGVHIFEYDPNIIGEITMPFCSEIGNYVWVKLPDRDWEGPFRAVDCAARYDIYNVVVHRKEVSEIHTQTAIRWGMRQEGTTGWHWVRPKIENVMISKINPGCLPDDLQPVVLADWFAERVQFWESKDEGMQWEKDNPRGIITGVMDNIAQWYINGEWTAFPHNSMECP